MGEIEKLRQRLSNAGKSAHEYRMSIKEANNLLKEIDALISEKEKPQPAVIIAPAEINRVIDGGTF